MQERQPTAPLFTQVDISAASPSQPVASPAGEQTQLLREILSAQDRQNELMEELVSHLTSAQRQRGQELARWKSNNPHLAQQCRQAAEALGRVHTEYLRTLSEEVTENADALSDGEFMMNEFVDRFGPRLAHLNGLLQVLSQLAGPAEA